MREAGLDALLVTSLPNVAYLSGLFASAAAVVITRDRFLLITDGRYLGIAKDVVADLTGVELVITAATVPFDQALAEGLCSIEHGRAGFEAAHFTVKRFSELQARMTKFAPGCGLEATEGLVERLRILKDEWELQVFAEAGARLSDAAKCIIPKALAGMREREVAAIIEAELRRVGFDKPAFDTIVASGPNSAVPHYRAGDRVLTAGDLVVLDFGGMFHGYAVDMTRTITMGPASARQRRLLEDVAAAQDAGFAMVRPGVPGDRHRSRHARVDDRGWTRRRVRPRHGPRSWIGSARTAPDRAIPGRTARRTIAAGHGVHDRAGRLFPRLGWRADRG